MARQIRCGHPQSGGHGLKFTPTPLQGVFVIEIESLEDERGFFARTWDKEEFKKQGLNSELIQCSISFNKKKGTLRGMHFQAKPYEEDKVVTCTRGGIFDVVVDLRPQSATFKKWFGLELSESNRKQLYIPAGTAHGFQTLTDMAEVHYQISQMFQKDHAGGVRWNDPAFGIHWPMAVSVISERDKNFPDFKS